MGDARQGRGSLGSQHSEAGGGSEKEPDGDPRGLQSSANESRRATEPRLQDLGHAELGPEDPEGEHPPEERAGEELPETLDPKDAVYELERALDQDAEEDIPEMSRLSISQKIPGTAVARARKKRRRRRLRELAEPKRDWQVVKDRKGCCCGGYAWISPCKTSLQFCLYWPSVYWTERFLEDTTLTITVPEVSRRVEELSRPRRFYVEHYHSNRCPGYPGQPKWQSPAPVFSSCQSRRSRPPCRKSGTPCRNPSHMCRTITASFTWPCPKLSRTSAFLTEILAGRCWMSPRRWWPAPASSPWPGPKCARASMRATTPITSPRPRWWPRRPLASMSLPPPKASPEKREPPVPASKTSDPVNTLRHLNPVYLIVLSLLAWRREGGLEGGEKDEEDNNIYFRIQPAICTDVSFPSRFG
uniref:testicular haploid expressed gene protein isoform X1 n=1 Tax=Callithrix jacchus TaxID=9483 RepID=UPI00159DCA8F|nr:testicular haploid expressed gene protein isoform X1 [Callithrix jacchus]